MNLPPATGYLLLADTRGVPRVTLEARGRPDEDRWAIAEGGCCLARDLEFEVERMPSSRTEEFLARTRFTLEEAIALWRAFLASENYSRSFLSRSAGFVFR